jgi:hypothetical protein
MRDLNSPTRSPPSSFKRLLIPPSGSPIATSAPAPDEILVATRPVLTANRGQGAALSKGSAPWSLASYRHVETINRQTQVAAGRKNRTTSLPNASHPDGACAPDRRDGRPAKRKLYFSASSFSSRRGPLPPGSGCAPQISWFPSCQVHVSASSPRYLQFTEDVLLSDPACGGN